MRTEHEGFGLVYERYAFGKLLEKLVRKHAARSVLEIPGGGVKAMPSLYSICMGLAGCEVTVVNGDKSALEVWKRLGIEDRVTFLDVDDVSRTEIPDGAFDFVWNFYVFGMAPNPGRLLQEMKRISGRYVCLLLSNKRNVGYYFHRFAHWYTKIPWTHGDVSLRVPKRVTGMMEKEGIAIKEFGFVDTPPWPDAIGFRDVRLHRLSSTGVLDHSKIDWHSDYFEFLEKNRFPLWMRTVYAFEQLPVPFLLKQFYAHLFYILGDVSGPPGPEARKAG